MPRLPRWSLTVVITVLSTPTGTTAQDQAVIDRIFRMGMEESRVEEFAQVLLDSIGPRLIGTPGFAAAGDWMLDTYESLGIEARQESYGTWGGWTRGYTHVDLIAPRVRTLESILLAWSAGTDGPVEGDVVILPVVSSPSQFDLWLSRVRGAFVLVSSPEPTCRADQEWEEWATPESFERMQVERTASRQQFQRRFANYGVRSFDELADRLASAGAAGWVSSRWSGGWGVNKVFSAPNRTLPAVDVSCEDYGLLYRLADRGQGPRLRLDARSEFLPDQPAFNIVAELPGTELPEEYVLLSAHLDSWDGASGATDNGTGTVMMLEAMRILAEVYPNPRRTILVGHWGAEEQGLIGSAAFAEDHPEVIDGLQAAFNQDNGTWRVDYIRMQGFARAGEHFTRWFTHVPEELARHVELDIPGVPERGGSDHMSFICRGVPGFRLQSSYPEYRQYTWHTNRDTYDKIVFDDLRNNATLAATLAYLASEDPKRVPSDRITLPVDERTGQPGEWPRCSAARRSSN